MCALDDVHLSHIFNEKSDVIWSDDEDGADGNRGDEDDCEKNNGVDRTMLLVAVLVLISVCVYIFSYISSLLCYIIFSFRVGMILAFPEKVSWSYWNISSRY